MALPYKQILTIAKIGPFEISTWGLLVVLGFLAALFIIVKEAKRRGLGVEEVYDLGLYSFIGGIIGARIGWLLSFGKEIGFIEGLKLWNGGMVWHGGLLGGGFASYIYLQVKKLNFWKYADLFAVGLPLGHAVGRFGCHLIGDHIGKVTSLPWAINLGGTLTHPVSLYETIGLLVIFGIIFSLRKRQMFGGALFSIYVMSYAAFRFFNDFLRAGDPVYLGLTVAQYTSILLLILFGSFIYYKKNGEKNN